MKDETLLAQVGSRWDDRTCAISMPIYETATYRHPALGQSTGFHYSRTSNPAHLVLEQALASLEGEARGFAFASGLAAIDAARVFMGHLRLPLLAASLGGVESILSYPATMSPDERQACGITGALVPLSVGLESVEDLWRDLDQALQG